MGADGAHTWGWFEDPYREHDYRYLSEGLPTKLVRDSGHESFDPPPDTPLTEPPIPATTITGPSHNGDDMRRADDAGRAAPYDRRAACQAATTAIIRFGSSD